MATLTIEPETFYAAGRRCFTIADDLAEAIDKARKELSATGAMSGSYDSGLKWGHAYDAKARKALETAGTLVSAIHNYGGVLVRSGFNYALADFDANIDGGTAPVMPSVPAPPTASSKTIPSSAGGHGEGLIDDFLGLVDKIGVPVPDGDTEKLSTAANAWRTLAKTQLPSLSEAAQAFSQVEAPEIEYIDDDLRALTSAIGDIRGTFSGLAQACTAYETDLEELRADIADFLEALAVELAISAAIGIAGSFISFGGTAAGAVAKAVHTVLKFAKLIAKKIRDWNKRRRENELEAVPDAKDAENTAERLDDLGKDGQGAPPPAKQELPPSKPAGVHDGYEDRPADNGKGTVWQRPGADGNADQVRIMDPGANPRYPDGYVRFYNKSGQPVRLDGRTGPPAETHIPRNPDGSYPIPEGW